MFLRVVVLLGLVAAAARAAAGCGYREFQCPGSHQCIFASARCDAEDDCENGNDEKGCDKTVVLPPNAKVEARVQYKEEHGAIKVLLCGEKKCSSVTLYGVRENGTLQYWTWKECNRLGALCEQHHEDHTEGSGYFAPGEVVLEVQRLPTELAVWRKGYPQHVAKVPVGTDFNTIRVRPEFWVDDNPVEFIRPAQECGYREFKCKNSSQCIHAIFRCDGERNCDDGSDEENCAFPTVTLPVNHTATARVQYKREHDFIEVSLCHNNECSVVNLHGVRDNGSLRYERGWDCDRQIRTCRHVEIHTQGHRGFPDGEIVLEVTNRPGKLVVWMKGRPDDAVEVHLKRHADTLVVAPGTQSSDMPVELTVSSSR